MERVPNNDVLKKGVYVSRVLQVTKLSYLPLSPHWKGKESEAAYKQTQQRVYRDRGLAHLSPLVKALPGSGW